MRFSTLALLATTALVAFVKASPLPAPELDPIAADKAARNKAILLLIKDIKEKKASNPNSPPSDRNGHNGLVVNTNNGYDASPEQLAALDTDQLIRLLNDLYN